jgi:hypothetical protein
LAGEAIAVSEQNLFSRSDVEALNAMDDESREQIEFQLASAGVTPAPPVLRVEVLAQVRQELRAARWDRRLARAAAVLLIVGVGINLAAGFQSDGKGNSARQPVAQAAERPSLVDTAIVVAEATDAATGRRFARQLAAMTGRELTADEVAAIDAAMRRTTSENRG